jgi:hypothetical protein
MSEYNIPCLVKFFSVRPIRWNSEGKMDKRMGTVIMCRKFGENDYAGPSKENGDGWTWLGDHVIPNPTPAQIAEEARKAGKVPMNTTQPAKPPKPDPLAQAIAEAKERLAGLEALRQAAQEHANRKGDVKLLAAREKELRAKWLPEKPKAAKAGRKGR